MLEVFRSTVLARGCRLVPVAVGLAICALLTTMAYIDPHPGALMPLSVVFTLLVSAGLVGLDVHQGSIHLLLTRPITRNQYLAGRLLGAAAVSFAFLAIAFGSSYLTAWLRWGRPGEVFWGALLVVPFYVAWVLAVVFFFSTFMPERADLLGYVGVLVTPRALDAIAAKVDSATVASALHWWSENVANMLYLREPSMAVMGDVLRWATNVVILIALGCLVFNRREFSYGSE